MQATTKTRSLLGAVPETDTATASSLASAAASIDGAGECASVYSNDDFLLLKNLFANAKKKKLSVDSETISSFINKASQTGHYAEAQYVFKKVCEGKHIDVGIIAAYIKAAIEVNDFDEVASVYDLACKQRMEKALHASFAGFIRAAHKAMKYTEAWHALKKIRKLKDKFELDLDTLNLLIDIVGKLGFFDEAKSLYNLACDNAIANSVTFSTFIHIAGISVEAANARAAYECAKKLRLDDNLVLSAYINAMVLANDIIAADKVFVLRRPELVTSKKTYDFHGLNFAETYIACRHIFARAGLVEIITGSGIYSPDISVVRQAFALFCKAHNIAVVENVRSRGGVFFCTIPEGLVLKDLRFSYDLVTGYLVSDATEVAAGAGVAKMLVAIPTIAKAEVRSKDLMVTDAMRDRLCELLVFDNTAIQQNAVTEISMLVQGHARNQYLFGTEAVKAGLLKLLNSDNPIMQVKAAVAIVRLIEGNTHNLNLFSAEGTTMSRSLIKLLASDNPNIQFNAAELIWKLVAGNSRNQDEFGIDAMKDWLLMRFASKYVDVQRSAMIAIRYLVEGHAENQNKFATEVMRNGLIRSLASDNSSIQSNAAATIWALVEGHAENQAIFGSGVVREGLLKLLAYDDPSIQSNAVLAIAYLARGHAENQTLFATKAMCEGLFKLLASDDLTLQSHAVFAIAQLARGHVENQKKFGTLVVREGLVKLLTSEHPGIQYKAAVAITWLLEGCAENQTVFGSEAMRDGLLSLLTSNEAREMNKVVIKAILQLVKGHSVNHDLFGNFLLVDIVSRPILESFSGAWDIDTISLAVDVALEIVQSDDTNADHISLVSDYFITAFNQHLSGHSNFLTQFKQKTRREIATFFERDISLFSHKLDAVFWAVQLSEYDYKKVSRPIVQHLISLAELDANLFLFDASIHAPINEFMAMLSDPSYNLLAYNNRGQTIVSAINEDPVLSAEDKTLRIQAYQAAIATQRMKNTSGFLLYNLHALSVEGTVLSFNNDLLPVSISAPYEIDGVDPASIQRFLQLLAWLNSQVALADYREAFATLAENPSIRESLLYAERLSLLEQMCVHLHQLLSHPAYSSDKLALHLVPHLPQFGMCDAGVYEGLDAINRSFEHSLAMHVVYCVTAALSYYAKQFAVAEISEVHIPQAQIYHDLGMDTHNIHRTDVNNLQVSPANLTAITRYAIDKFSRTDFIEVSSPQLLDELLNDQTEVNFTDDALDGWLIDADRAVALRYYIDFNINGTLAYLHEQLQEFKKIGMFKELPDEARLSGLAPMLAFLSAADLSITQAKIEKYEAEIAELNSDAQLKLALPSNIDGLKEILKLKTEQYLIAQGIIQSAACEADVKAKIWEILTTDPIESARDLEKISFWKKLLNALDGLALVRQVIEAHTDALASMHLDAFLWQPDSCGKNLFRAIAQDPAMTLWAYGMQLIHAQTEDEASISFVRTETPAALQGILANFMTDHDEKRKELELEHLIHVPGALLFWLMTFQSDPQRENIFTQIIHFITEYESYRYDSLIQVICEMQYIDIPEMSVCATSFLEYRLQHQISLDLFDIYWQSACFMADFTTNWDQLASNKDLLLSLNNKDNMRRFILLNIDEPDFSTQFAEVIARQASNLTKLEVEELVKLNREQFALIQTVCLTPAASTAASAARESALVFLGAGTVHEEAGAGANL